jgi:hypothetical protein
MEKDRSTGNGRVGILAYALKSESGESRQAVNLALGLKRRGLAPSIFTVAASAEIRATCRALGIPVLFNQDSLGTLDWLQVMLYSDRLASRLTELVRRELPCENYLVVQDAAIATVASRLPGKMTYLCCGDMLLLLLNRGFRRSRNMTPSLLSFGFVQALDRHARFVAQFDRVLANSQFTKGMMSYLYDCPIAGVVYPPVDTDLFSPTEAEPSKHPYVFAVLRDNAEPTYHAVARLAARTAVRVVGRGKVPHATSLGNVSDQELVRQYSGARVTVSPSFREFFGYPIVESMSCGTPSVAFAQGGAREIITAGTDGWLALNEAELIECVEEKLSSGYPETVRRRCRETAQKFSIDASSIALVHEMGL